MAGRGCDWEEEGKLAASSHVPLQQLLAATGIAGSGQRMSSTIKDVVTAVEQAAPILVRYEWRIRGWRRGREPERRASLSAAQAPSRHPLLPTYPGITVLLISGEAFTQPAQTAKSMYVSMYISGSGVPSMDHAIFGFACMYIISHTSLDIPS